MSVEKLQSLFEEMTQVYVKCLRHTMALRLAEAWADKPDGWYAYFKEIDAKNSANAGGSVTDITAEVENIYQFDLQACNKTMNYLKEVRDVIYRAAGVSKALSARINPYYMELLKFRNQYVGHENYTEEQLSHAAEERDQAVEKMHLILQNAFRDTVDPESAAGNTYFSRFEQLRLDYINEHKTKAYYLAEHLDLTKYDAAKFLPTCKKLGIDTDVVDDKYIFYTYNLNETVSLLRNFMAMNGDGQPTPAKPAEAKPAKKQTMRIVLIIAGAVVTLAVIAGILSVISKIGGVVSDAFGQFGGQSNGISAGDVLNAAASQLQGNQETDVSAPASSVSSGTEETDSTNQIPAQYAQKVQALMYGTEGRLELMTLEVTVGGYATPHQATTWGGGVIYSQDTTIAVGEGFLVKGVSPGETYVIYEYNGHAIAYRILVTD